jgi:F0F1-type ATP synthase membrane subunit b/b'
VKRMARLFAPVPCRAVALSGVSFFLIAVPAIAEEAASLPENSQTGWIFRWINFAIVFAAMVYFFAKVAAPSLRSRSEEVAEKIAEAARAREAAEKQHHEVQAKLAGIDQEVARLGEEAKRSMEAEAARLKALARQEAEVIERAAQAEIVAAERAGALETKALAARLAIERAESVLARQITPEVQASLFQRFVAELDRSAN